MARAQPRPRNAGDHLRSDHETQQSPFVVGYRLKWCSPPLPRTPSQQPVCATFGAKTRLRSESFARSFTDSGCIIEGTTLRCRALRISPTNEDVGQFSFTVASGITTSAASEHGCRSGTASSGSPSFAATERATSASYSRLGAWVSAPSFFGNAASGAIRSVLATFYVGHCYRLICDLRLGFFSSRLCFLIARAHTAANTCAKSQGRALPIMSQTLSMYGESKT